MNKNLLLLRGLPGSGKTTFAKVLEGADGFQVFSLDDFFTDKDGNYAFDYKQNHLAYKTCQSQTEAAMKNGVSKILVDQTFALLWELQPYLVLAATYGYRVFVCTMENRHDGENSHGITDEQLVKMAKGFKVELLPERLRGKEEKQKEE
jgi:predicted kinase